MGPPQCSKTRGPKGRQSQRVVTLNVLVLLSSQRFEARSPDCLLLESVGLLAAATARVNPLAEGIFRAIPAHWRNPAERDRNPMLRCTHGPWRAAGDPNRYAPAPSTA